ncbi:MAG: arginine decarboxylase, pyruvoyl-dependent [Planctomycetes bacterium]|nr:arginine decarboxylase, pyruvoyl-dependent [Planctomycetota bacterium]
MLVPRSVFLVAGVGTAREKLVSFEEALRQAGIEAYNLVCVSSILPPRCEIVPPAEGVTSLEPGGIVHCVLARLETDEEGRQIAVAIGMARPKDRSSHGYVAEVDEHDLDGELAAAKAVDLATTMLDTTLRGRRPAGPFVTRSVSSSAVGRAGLWTTAVAAAVFVV